MAAGANELAPRLGLVGVTVDQLSPFWPSNAFERIIRTRVTLPQVRQSVTDPLKPISRQLARGCVRRIGVEWLSLGFAVRARVH